MIDICQKLHFLMKIFYVVFPAWQEVPQTVKIIVKKNF